MQLMMQLVDHDPGPFQCLPARRRDTVDPSPPSGYVPQTRLQQAAAFHSVEEWIERSRPNPIAVMFQLFHHRKAKDRLVRSMNEYMDANESRKKFPLLGFHNLRIPFSL